MESVRISENESRECQTRELDVQRILTAFLGQPTRYLYLPLDRVLSARKDATYRRGRCSRNPFLRTSCKGLSCRILALVADILRRIAPLTKGEVVSERRCFIQGFYSSNAPRRRLSSMSLSSSSEICFWVRRVLITLVVSTGMEEERI